MLDMWPHPLTAAGRMTTALPASTTTLRQALDALWKKYPTRHVAEDALLITLNGVIVPCADWASTGLVPGSVVTLRAVAQGGGDSNPMAVVAMLALTFAAPGLGNLATGAAWGTKTTFLSTLAATGVALAGGLVINALFPPPRPEGPDTAAPRQVYSLAGGANRPRLHQPMMLVLGEHRVYPDLLASPYLDMDGQESDLQQMVSFGLGNLDISDIRVGDTPLDDYIGVQKEILREGRVSTIVRQNTETIDGAELGSNEPSTQPVWVTRELPTGTRTAKLLISAVLYDQRGSGKKGRADPRGHNIDVWYRDTASDATVTSERVCTTMPGHWKTLQGIFNQEWVPPVTICKDVERTSGPWVQKRVFIKGDQRNLYRQTYSIALDPGKRYEVRTRIVGKIPNDRGAKLFIKLDAIVCHKENVPQSSSYYEQTRMAVKIRASKQLHGRLERLSAIVQQKLPVYRGGRWGVPEATSNPAFIFRAFARGWRDEGGRLLAGAGLDEKLIDDASIIDWGKYCDTQRLACNLALTGTQTAEQVLTTIAQCGRASLDWAAGKLGVVWDAANKPVTAMFGPQSILAGSFAWQWAGEEVAEEIICNFINPAMDWQQDTVRRVVPGIVGPRKTATLTLPGITNRAQAQQACNLLAAKQKYHRRRLSWEVGAEGLAVRRGDVVYVSHSLIDGGITGRLEMARWGHACVVLDRDIEVGEGDATLVLRLPDGSVQQYTATELAEPPKAEGVEYIYTRWTKSTITQPLQLPQNNWVYGKYKKPNKAVPLKWNAFKPKTKDDYRYVFRSHRATVSQDWSTPILIGCHAAAGAARALLLDKSLPPAPDGADELVPADCHFRWYGTAGAPRKVKVVAIEPLSATRVRISAIDEIPEYYDSSNIAANEPLPTLYYRVPQVVSGAVSNAPVQIGRGSMQQITLALTVTGDWRGGVVYAGKDVVATMVDGASRTQWLAEHTTDSVTITVVPGSEAAPLGAAWSTEYTMINVVAPDPVADFAVTVLTDGTRRFSWTPSDFPGVVGYQIRYHVTNNNWDNMLPLHDGVLTATNWESFEPDVGNYVFAIVAVTSDGVLSEAAYIMQQLNAPRRLNVDGADGDDGTGVEYIFKVTSTTSIPSNLRPLNTWGYDQPGGRGWKDAAPDLTAALPYLWRAQRKVVGQPTAGAAVAANWSAPVIVGRYGPKGDQGVIGPRGERGLQGIAGADGRDGADGADGDDGVGLEYIFKRTSATSIPTNLLPLNSWGYDRPGGRGWSDAAPNLSAGLPYLWRAERKVMGQPTAGTAVTDNWSAPVIVGRFGPKGDQGIIGPQGARGLQGIAGADGADGDDGRDGTGVEYIFKRTSATSIPTNLLPLNTWGYDQPGGRGWKDAAPNLSAGLPYLWRAQRKVIGQPTAGAAVTDNWSAPVIVGRYGADGAKGDRGLQGIAGADGSDGADGDDGTGVEYIFKRTSGASIPTNLLPLNSWGYDRPGGRGWSDAAPNLSAGLPYLWRAERKVMGQPTAGTAVTDNWSAPVIVGHYGEKGDKGDTGQYETSIVTQFIYNHTDSNAPPPRVTGGEKNDTHLPNGWTYNSYNAARKATFIWYCQRRGKPGAWSAWSVPALFVTGDVITLKTAYTSWHPIENWRDSLKEIPKRAQSVLWSRNAEHGAIWAIGVEQVVARGTGTEQRCTTRDGYWVRNIKRPDVWMPPVTTCKDVKVTYTSKKVRYRYLFAVHE